MKQRTANFWPDFVHAGITYDLSHLQPVQRRFMVAPRQGDAIELVVNISFSLHCFTTKEASAQNLDMRYPDPANRETRYFDVQRYVWSKELLVQMIDTIEQRRIWHTPHEGFFSVEFEHHGKKLFYTVFFEVGRAKKKTQTDHHLWFYVSSAYDKSRAPARMDRSIKFATILRKAWFG